MQKHKRILYFLCTLLAACFLVFIACREDAESDSFSDSSITSSSEFSAQEEKKRTEEEEAQESKDENTKAEKNDGKDVQSQPPQNDSEKSDASADSEESENSDNSEESETSEEENASAENTDGAEENSSAENESSKDEAEEPSIPPHEHDWKEVSRIEYCMAYGTIFYDCTGCEETKTEDASPIGHEEVTDDPVKATCQTEGKTEGSHCSRCQEILTAQENLGTVDHDYVDYTCQWCDVVELNFESAKGAYYVTGTNATYARRVVIPDMHNGYSVKGIKENAFAERYELNSITFGENVEIIGDGAFSSCYNLVEVYDRSNVHITQDASYMIDINNYAKGIYTEEYESKIRIDEDGYITYEDGEEKLLIGYKGTETQLELPEGITEINGYAFAKCKGLTKVTISSTVKKLKSHAFSKCTKLTDLTIGKNVTWIGDNLFDEENALEKVLFEDPEGWYLGTMSSGEDGTLFGEDISDPQVACLGFKGDWLDLFWTKKE